MATSTAANGVMMQFFHWYASEEGELWREVAERAGDLAAAGVTSLWLPPPGKGAGGGYDVGYGVYDLFDLGEFDQKGSVRTRWGTRDELIAAVEAAHDAGLAVYADAVFNHKMGGDEPEEMQARPVDPDDRTREIGEARTIRAYTKFTFPGRGGRYSEMTWHWHHFTAVDHDTNAEDEHAIYLFEGAEFAEGVDLEKGNYDYLMGCDLNTRHPEVRGELDHWGRWIVETVGFDGFRFDAVKHVDANVFREWLGGVREATGRELFAVGEYWSFDAGTLERFIGTTDGSLSLFDAPLHRAFHEAGRGGNDYDMRTIFDGSLVARHPTLAVTLVENHDTQPLQGLEAVIEPWFKPLAYALILLREGGYPCVFYADYYGAEYRDTGRDGNEHDIVMPSHRVLIDVFLRARRDHARGEQRDWFDHANCVGWTRMGDGENGGEGGGLAVVLSNGDAGSKWMETGRPDTEYLDLTGHIEEPITSNGDGWAEFRCNAGSVSVWVPRADLEA